MLATAKLLLTTFVGFIVIDYVWLNFVAKKFYIEQMSEVGRIQNGEFKPIIWAAIIVYILLALGIVYFILPQIEPGQGFLQVFLCGAFFGLICYGVYDMTNLSTLKSWPLALAAADMAWGAFVTGVVTVIAQYVKSL
ncbi:MAG: DUF2177 family protein [Bdellovibrio sp.]|nr:DUF2177 family protein [Bdellovibrio sp.]